MRGHWSRDCRNKTKHKRYVFNSKNFREQVKACRKINTTSVLAHNETFWSETLHAPEFVISVVKAGYKIPFSEIPEKKQF